MDDACQDRARDVVTHIRSKAANMRVGPTKTDSGHGSLPYRLVKNGKGAPNASGGDGPKPASIIFRVEKAPVGPERFHLQAIFYLKGTEVAMVAFPFENTEVGAGHLIGALTGLRYGHAATDNGHSDSGQSERDSSSDQPKDKQPA